uniref:Acyltransferase 3 domain-containing protein n=1 Tax=Pyramimonas obovata TaxID=1411642 RepID=A0A7S0RSY5_9CHLO|mmetsp:Transcript_5994/g.12206  ORF Transcript_5994/g.12206 Transcript_5994/m.12206 type:complete len:507 (+) Transcript_5994:260-1780(+)
MSDVRGAAAGRLPQLKHLDGLRVVFCLAIQIQHIKQWDTRSFLFSLETDQGKDGPGRFEHILHAASELGVSYFFVIGGYLAFYTAATKPTASWGERKQYVWKRFARLMPTLWVSGIIYVVLTELFENAKAKPVCSSWRRPPGGRGCALSTAGAGSFAWAVFLYAFALQDISPIPQGISVNEPAWFVSAMCFCYIAYICIHKYLVERPWSARTVALLLLLLLLVRSLPTLAYYLPCQLSFEDVIKPRHLSIIQPRPPFVLDRIFFWYEAFYHSPVIRFLEFLIGALVAKLGLHEDVKLFFTTNRRLAEIGSDLTFAVGALWMLFVYTGQDCQRRFKGSGDLFGHCLPLAFWMLISTHSKPEMDDCKYYGVINKLLTCNVLVTLSPWSYGAYMYQLDVKVLTAKTGLLYEIAVDAKFSIIVFMWLLGGIMHTVLEAPAAAWLLKRGPSAQRPSLPVLSKDSSLVQENPGPLLPLEDEPLIQRKGQGTSNDSNEINSNETPHEDVRAPQ